MTATVIRLAGQRPISWSVCQRGYTERRHEWQPDGITRGTGQMPVIGHESFGASVGAPYIWYDRGAWVHKQIAKEVYAKLPILDEEQFDEVVWGVVWGALKDAPQMFQISMGKQTSDECMYVAGVNKNLAKYKPR